MVEGKYVVMKVSKTRAALLSQLEKASRSSAEFSNMIIEQARKYFG